MANFMNNLLIKLSEVLENSIQLASAELENGTTLTQESDQFTIGELAYFQDVDGNVTPATEGDWTATDGSIYTIDANGILVSISMPAINEPAPLPDASAPAVGDTVETVQMAEVEVIVEEAPEEEPMVEEEVPATLDVEALMATISDLVNRVASLEEQLSTVSATTQELSKQPAAVALSALPQTIDKPLSREEIRIARFKAMADEQKNK